MHSSSRPQLSLQAASARLCLPCSLHLRPPEKSLSSLLYSTLASSPQSRLQLLDNSQSEIQEDASCWCAVSKQQGYCSLPLSLPPAFSSYLVYHLDAAAMAHTVPDLPGKPREIFIHSLTHSLIPETGSLGYSRRPGFHLCSVLWDQGWWLRIPACPSHLSWLSPPSPCGRCSWWPHGALVTAAIFHVGGQVFARAHHPTP